MNQKQIEEIRARCDKALWWMKQRGEPAAICLAIRSVPDLLDALEEAQTEIAQLKVALSDAESSAEHWCETSAGFVDEIRMAEAENERLQREVGRLRRERDIALGLEDSSD